jgi:hypothetical protein
MKKRVLGIAMIGALTLVSCNKEVSEADFTDSISTEDESLRLPEAGYTINKITELGGVENDRYTEGVIQYEKNGEILATVDFADGTGPDEAMVEINGEKHECHLEKKDWDKKKKYGKGKKHHFKKVIVEPIVKTDDCDYIVSGIVKVFDKNSGDWVATIDFGDGTCDDQATKETADGFYTFTLKEYNK